METFDALWEYCTLKKRAVPNPITWNELYNCLQDKHRTSSGGWEPPLPLILGAWNFASPLEKHLRFKEHLQWADKKGQINEVGALLRALPEEKWCHFGEI